MKIIKKILMIVVIIYISITLFNISKAINISAEPDGIVFSFLDPLYFDGENHKTTEAQKQFNTNIVITACIFLVIYWLILLYLFEKENPNDYIYENPDDIETLKKHSPLIAGCIVDNRNVLPRDIIAEILSLIQKGHINMEMTPNPEKGEEDYTYTISENRENNQSLTKTEGYIMNWIFGFYEEDKVDLMQKIKEIKERKDFSKKLDELNEIAEEELNQKGANINTVPKFIKGMNIVLSIIAVLLSALHIVNNGINLQIYQTTILLFFLIVVAIILIIPVVALIIHITIMLVILLKKLIKHSTEVYSGKKIVETSAVTFFFMFLLIAILYCIVSNKYICLDVFMIGMSVLIVRTDNLMTKHNKEILNDYYSLKEIKYRIENYTLIKDEQINYMKLWDEYLIYAVAFGIPIPIVKKLRSTYKETEDLKYLAKCEGLYYISKAYLEVMWDMDFNKNKKRSK